MISGLVYLLLSRSLDVAAEAPAISASEHELRAIDAVAGTKDGGARLRALVPGTGLARGEDLGIWG